VFVIQVWYRKKNFDKEFEIIEAEADSLEEARAKAEQEVEGSYYSELFKNSIG
jgi:hypothetical protein